MPADDHAMQPMRLHNLFYLTEAPGGEQNFIAGFFESLDERGEEVGVGRVIQIDPDAHFASRLNHNPTGLTNLTSCPSRLDPAKRLPTPSWQAGASSRLAPTACTAHG